MPSQSNAGKSYGLGELIREYPLNIRGMTSNLLFLAAFGAALLVFGVYLHRNGTSLLGRQPFEFPMSLVYLGFVVILLVVGLLPIIQIILLTKSWRAILDPPPELHSKQGGLLLLFVLPVMVLIFTKPGIGLMIAGGGVLWAALSILVQVQRHRGQLVQEFEQGITMPINGEVTPIRWEDINAVWMRGGGGHIGRYDEAPVKIESLWLNSNQLLSHIHKKVSERLYAEMLERYNAGETVRFGRVEVSQQGIAVGRTMFPWQKVDHIIVDALGVSIRYGSRTRRLFGVSAQDIPNLNLFLTLTSHILSPSKTEAVSVPEMPAAAIPLEKVREYRPAVIRLVFIVVWLAIGTLLAVADWFNLFRYSSGSPHFIIHIGGLVSLVALYKLIAWLQSFGVWIRLSEDALTYTRFGETVVLDWEDVQSVRVYFVSVWQIVLARRYTLVDKDGRVIHLRQGLSDIGTLGDFVQKQVNAVLFPRAARRVENGEQVRFSRWGVSQQGIHDRKRILPWEEVGEIVVKPRAVLVKGKGKLAPWARIPVMGTPNLVVFLTLARQYVKYELPSFRVS